MKAIGLSFVLALAVGVGAASASSFVQARNATPTRTAADSLKALTPDTGTVRVVDSAGVSHQVPIAALNDSTRRAAAGRDSAVATTAAAATAAARIPAAEAPVATTPVPSPTPTPTNAVASVQGKTQAPQTRSSVKAPDTAADTETSAPNEKRIAKVFGAMAPRDAAKFLDQMGNSDVAIILGNLTEKQEAAILAQLPAPRVAALSKAGLRARPAGGTK